MQEAWDAYYTACYNSQYRVQGFYDTLMDHAQNMLVYPNSYNIMDMFLCGLQESMHAKRLKNGLTPEANMVKDFMAEGNAIEEAAKTQEHYKWQVVVPVTQTMDLAITCPKDSRPKRVRVTLMKKSHVKDLDNSFNQKPQIYVSMMNY